ncbi:patatin-like phospholipase family protein [Deminuibacter soli]|uniref:PNPLA domain-containing protein n=1 Tax=Deminuibacter soli TaxID=2291815 RepID=A0A3E1NJD8_9BACT|nr:patatin-like phospholipase family protein [Deminuibacter soli]RFM28055.1 hypothetical protein DXN05_10985 [Deminuibacter soli]
MKIHTSILFLLCLSTAVFAQRPKLGLTLSGGGAKGLAHIGILKAIDSAGLRIDYVTGTSMGSIMGALYAAGYSADSIEKIARSVNWDILLSNAASLRSLGMDEKAEYDRYAIELPWVNHGFRFPSGLLESEELWLKFSELFFPVYKIKNFNDFPRPFKCIATDVSNGEAVVLDQGDISAAVRSSMSIPSVFTAVDYNGKKLVDGGIVRNFPVRDARKMGADYVIGSSVSGGLLAKEKINNVFQILLQIAFFREDEDARQEKKLCDLYIHTDLENYSMGSFGNANEIIEEGLHKGRELYPVFKHLADSLNAIYGEPKSKPAQLPDIDSVKVTQYTINGLKKIEPSFFLHRLQFENNRWYTPKQLSTQIRLAFGTRYFKKITYTLEPLPDGTVRIVFDVTENPFTFAKLGIFYNSFAGFSLITNFTTRNFFTPYSRSLVTLNLGDNLRIRGEHIQYFGKYKHFSSAMAVQAEEFGYSTYDHFKKDGLYKRRYFFADWNVRIAPSLSLMTGIGTRFEYFHYKPDIPSHLELNGDNSFLNSYYFLKYNTLSNGIFPKRGLQIDVEAGVIYNQANNLKFFTQGSPVYNTDSLGFRFGPFGHAQVNVVSYTPLANKLTLITQAQGAANSKGGQGILNDYLVGGLNGNFRNQVTFAGFYTGAFRTSSLVSALVGLRYEMYSNFYLTARSNALYHDFINDNQKLRAAGFLTGYALSAGYNFILGPLEISMMYSDQSKRVLPYVNLGLNF